MLAVFLLPLLAKDVHYLVAHLHHDNHIHHCNVSGVHLHDPEHYTPENCSFCGIVYAQFVNNADSPSVPVADLQDVTTGINYSRVYLKSVTSDVHPRGPPISILC